MKVLKLSNLQSQAKYRLNEYTSLYGSIIFDDSKGGSITNTYPFEFNKIVNSNTDTEEGYVEKSFIIFYIDAKNHTIKHIDFVGLSHFEIKEDKKFSCDIVEPFCKPIIDVSTWVSSFGNIISPNNDQVKFLSTEDHVNVVIQHNGSDTIRFLFGNIAVTRSLNEEISFTIDTFNNLSSITIKNPVEVSKLLKLFLQKGMG